MPQPDGCKLFRNDGKGHFTDVTEKAGLRLVQGQATCAAWGDVDNDGHLDLVVGCLRGPNRFFRNKGDGTFEDATEAIGLDQRIFNTQAVCLVDLNNDGMLDLVFNNEGQESCVLLGNPEFAKKKTPVTLQLAAKTGVTGSRVEVLDKEGKTLLATYQVSGGDGRGGQAAPTARFALSPGKYRVEVQFSDGCAAPRKSSSPARTSRRARRQDAADGLTRDAPLRRQERQAEYARNQKKGSFTDTYRLEAVRSCLLLVSSVPLGWLIRSPPSRGPPIAATAQRTGNTDGKAGPKRRPSSVGPQESGPLHRRARAVRRSALHQRPRRLQCPDVLRLDTRSKAKERVALVHEDAVSETADRQFAGRARRQTDLRRRHAPDRRRRPALRAHGQGTAAVAISECRATWCIWKARRPWPTASVYLGGGAAGVLCVDPDRLTLDGKEQTPAEIQKILDKKWADLQEQYQKDKKKDPTSPCRRTTISAEAVADARLAAGQGEMARRCSGRGGR